MVPATSQAHHHDHAHGHVHAQPQRNDFANAHVHDAASPHPAQAAPWSILRMTMVARLSAAVAVCAVLWGVVFLAMR